MRNDIIETTVHEECVKTVANEQMCDPRALCELQSSTGGVLSGGVRCTCVGVDVHTKPGAVTEGQQCEQDTSIGMMLQTQDVSITVSKPSNGSGVDGRIVLRATGEKSVSVAYSASMVRQSGAVGSVGAQLISSRSWSLLDEARLSLDGHAVIWSALPPASDSNFELDARLKRYAVTKEYVFQVALDCHGEAACVADGDTVETAIEVALESSRGGVARSVVRIKALVQSLVSCENSHAWIESGSDSLTSSKLMRVRFSAYDVDKVPVSQHRAPVEFRFGSRVLPQQWNTSTNEYVAEASAAGTPGLRTLRVILKPGWDNASRVERDCVVLERQIEVLAEPEGDSWRIPVAIGAVAGVVAFVLALCCICVKKQSTAKCLIAVVPGRALSSRTWLWGS
jgi:hypothetical protein